MHARLVARALDRRALLVAPVLVVPDREVRARAAEQPRGAARRAREVGARGVVRVVALSLEEADRGVLRAERRVDRAVVAPCGEGAGLGFPAPRARRPAVVAREQRRVVAALVRAAQVVAGLGEVHRRPDGGARTVVEAAVCAREGSLNRQRGCARVSRRDETHTSCSPRPARRSRCTRATSCRRAARAGRAAPPPARRPPRRRRSRRARRTTRAARGARSAVRSRFLPPAPYACGRPSGGRRGCARDAWCGSSPENR